jgi:hypothetical protein
MADIELVIKIPESQYKTLHAKTQVDVVDVIDDKLLIDAIKNGMPLSKGHGDLVDRKELLSHEKCTYRRKPRGNEKNIKECSMKN